MICLVYPISRYPHSPWCFSVLRSTIEYIYLWCRVKAGSSAFLTATQGIAINCLLGVDQYTECYQETDSQYGDFWSELGWDGFFCTSQLCHVVRHLDKKNKQITIWYNTTDTSRFIWIFTEKSWHIWHRLDFTTVFMLLMSDLSNSCMF